MFIGHQKIKDFFKKAISADKLAQAYLFSGPKSVGKFTLASDLANELTENKGGKINPDIIIVAPREEAKEIKVADIREMQRKLNLSSSGKKYKVAIIDEAEKMNLAAQNALLKTLEEPPAKTVLILVAQNPDQLLPTVVSRCQNKKFSLVSNTEIKKILPQDLNNREKILFWSLGCPGLVVKLADNSDEIDKREETLKELKNLFSQSITEKMALAENISRLPELAEKMNWWLVALRNNLIFGGFKSNPAVSKERNLRLMDKICAEIEIIQKTNSNARLVLENLFLEF